MGAQPFWILFDAAVIENWKRHIISQKKEKLSLETKSRQNILQEIGIGYSGDF